MRIDELDEFQGLTPDMVRAWLANLDPSIRPSACIGGDIEAVSELCGETSQSLLREINPRMRQWPSRKAVVAHSGPWVARRGANPAILCTIREDGWMHTGHPTYAPWITKDDLSNAKEWRFWPCDEHGNKVRWPTDAEGKML